MGVKSAFILTRGTCKEILPELSSHASFSSSSGLYWLIFSPAAALLPRRAGGGVGLAGGRRRPGGPVLVGGCGDGGRPAAHRGGQGRGAAGLHLQQLTARGRQRGRRGLLRKTTGEEGDDEQLHTDVYFFLPLYHL